MSKKNYINIAHKYDRVVVLVDMDCFYCQVEEKLNPSLAGKPIAVVQYNAWQGGGIIAVNYPARAQGVTRHMRGDEAKEQCPDIELVRVPNIREKADLTKYREAGKDVAAVLQSFTPLLERASVDEAYLDITENVGKRLEQMNQGLFKLQPTELLNTYAVGYDDIGNFIQEISSKYDSSALDDFEFEDSDLPAIQKSDLNLLLGASIVNEIRAKVKEKTGYECSAGIAHNKILAKLACGMNKPNKQTILPLRQIEPLFNTLPVGKVKGLGGKFGEDVCERLRIKFIGDLEQFSENELQRKFDEKSGSWLYLIARGIDLEAVTPRLYSKSIGCCKKFPGRNCITGLKTLTHWLNELSKEICDRMEKDEIENNRKAKQMVVSYIQEINGNDVSSSRSTNQLSNTPALMAEYALKLMRQNTEQFFKVCNENVLNNPIKFLGISVGKFEPIETKQYTLQKMFMNISKKTTTQTTLKASETAGEIVENASISSGSKEESSESKKTDIKPTVNSFFAAHLKKQRDNVNVNDINSNNDNSGNKEVKSFFLNAIKTKNIEKKEDPELTDVTDNLNDNNIAEKSTTSIHKKSTITTMASNLDYNPSDKSIQKNTEEFDEPIPSTSKQYSDKISDYTRMYAEFAVPEPTENDYINCEKCNKRILSYTLQAHMDFHFAFELSREQREIYRQEIKSKFKSPPAKKLKTNSLGKKNQDNNTLNKSNKVNYVIEKFLVKKDDLNVNNSRVNDSSCDEPTELCQECGLQIPITKILEHQDYHTAKRLQMEMDRSAMQESSQSSIALLTTPTADRKPLTTKEGSNKNRSITTYFASPTS